ncbi:MAG: LCP family protein [Christensenellales bacterium]
MSKQDIDKLPVEYVGNVKKIEKEEGVYNILLFGVDSRERTKFESELSDVMILVTMDTSKKTIKMVSFMRDCYVKMPGHHDNRLNTAYKFGGSSLAIQTFQNNFGIDVDWYAVVNFWSMAEMIDALGGVKVDLTSSEVDEININLVEINAEVKKGEKSPNLKSSGTQKLDGKQAVAYMRIRKLSGGDFKRTERQRTVMKGLIASVKKMSLDQMLSLVDIIPDYVRTNMSLGEMANVAQAFYGMRGADIQELRIPVDGGYSNYDSMLKLDYAVNYDALNKFLAE